jgi:hypothetical protein
LARYLKAGTDYLSPLAVRRIIQVANEDITGSLTAVCRIDREVHKLSITHPGGDPIEQMERQRPKEGAEMHVPTEVHLADAKAHLRLLNAHLAALKNQVSAEAPQVSPEAPQVSPEVPPVSAEVRLEATEADLVPAEADQGPAEV